MRQPKLEPGSMTPRQRADARGYARVETAAELA